METKIKVQQQILRAVLKGNEIWNTLFGFPCNFRLILYFYKLTFKLTYIHTDCNSKHFFIYCISSRYYQSYYLKFKMKWRLPCFAALCFVPFYFVPLCSAFCVLFGFCFAELCCLVLCFVLLCIVLCFVVYCVLFCCVLLGLSTNSEFAHINWGEFAHINWRKQHQPYLAKVFNLITQHW